MKRKWIRKVMAGILSASMVLSGIGFVPGSKAEEVYAAEEMTSGDWEYYLVDPDGENSDPTDDDAICISGYTGNKREITFPTKLDGHTVIEVGHYNEDATYAVKGLDNVKKLTIPSNVKTIGYQGLSRLEKVQEIVLSEGLETISEQAFYESGALVKINLPDSLTELGKSAFEMCESLKSIDIPGSVSEIKENTFSECTSLKKVTIGEGVTSIGDSAFSENDGYAGHYLCENLESVTLPESLESIGNSVFYRDANLRSVNLPENMTSIGDSAFNACPSLEIDHLPEKLSYLGDRAFMDCADILSMTIPGGVTAIGEYAFSGCINMQTLKMEEGVEEIGRGAFGKSEIDGYDGDTRLQTIIFPDTLTTMGNGAFESCVGLVEISLPDSLETMGDSVFAGCENLEKIRFSENLESIGQYAFRECKLLKEAILPDSLEELGDNAFYECTALEKISTGNGLRTIETETFGKCKNLTEIVIGSKLEDVGSWAFAKCKSLTEVNLPENVRKIRSNAFNGCENLRVFTMGNHVSIMEDEIFIFDDGLKKLVISDGLASMYGTQNWSVPEKTRVVTVSGTVLQDVDFSQEDISTGYSAEVVGEYTYTGEKIEPAVVVKNSFGRVLGKGSEYIITCSDNVNAGTAKAVIIGRGDYTGKFEVPFVIGKGIPVFKKLPAGKELTANGTNQELVTAGVSSGGTIVYALEENGTYTEKIPTAKNAGSYTVYYKIKGDENCFDAEGGKVAVTIKKDGSVEESTDISTLTFSTIAPVTYNGTHQKPAVTVKDGNLVLKAGTDYNVEYSNNLYAGTHAKVTCTGIGNYTGTKEIEFTIEKAESKVTKAPAAKELTENGTSQALLNAGTAEGGTLVYALAENGTYSENIPTGKEAKEYTVYYKVRGDSNHKDSSVSQVKVTIKEKNPDINKEADSGFTLGKNTNSFVHTDYPGWGEKAGFLGVKTYELDEDYYKRLTANSDYSEKNRIKMYMNEEWGGSCYGIAMSMGLLHEDYINVSDLTNSRNATNYYSIGCPCKDRKFRNMINFYQLSQLLDVSGKEDAAVSMAYNEKMFGKFDWYSSYDSLSVCLKKLVTHALEGETYLMGLSNAEGGHAVLITGCKFDKTTRQYKVKVFDENSVGLGIGNFSYMDIAEDFSSFSYKDANRDEYTEDTYECLYFLDWDKISKNIVPEKKEITGAAIDIEMAGDFKLVNDEGEYFECVDGIYNGNMNIRGISTVENSSVDGEDDGSHLIIETDAFKDLTITNIEDDLDVNIYNADEFQSLAGKNIDSAEMSFDDGIQIKGNDYSFKAYMTTDKISDDEAGLVSVSANAKGDVSLNDSGKLVNVKSSNTMTDIVSENLVGTKVTESKQKDSDSVTISSDESGKKDEGNTNNNSKQNSSDGKNKAQNSNGSNQKNAVVTPDNFVKDGITYKLSGNLASVQKAKNTVKTVSIPASITAYGKNYKVTSIAENAFKNCKKLKKVVIGKNIVTIGKNAFKGCKKLKNIMIQTTKIKKIAKGAFAGIKKKAIFKVKASNKQLKKIKNLIRKGGAKKPKIKRA